MCVFFFASPWTGCDKNGEGCGERMKEKEREERALLSSLSWPVSFESFYVRHGVLVEGWVFLSLCHRVCMREEGGVKIVFTSLAATEAPTHVISF